ncbi:protein DMP3 [Ricinus communis]|uniref:protein DMP3 n=1 Tax=Ricinus communis TaxID=3988 RepID=UPI000D69D184|nr:protein DMP3 [Ricinus communis]|eukprot:XP_025015580.1 protein DMP3 [Ricinus communis]
MDSSNRQDLIQSCEGSEDYYYPRDDYPDESHYLYLINAILSGTARLNVLLPTATILAFTIFAPLLTNDGECGPLNRWLMGVFWGLLAASCIFFTFTDSFRTSTGRLSYGMATFRGIWTFNGGRKRPSVPSDYRLRKVINIVPLAIGFVISVLFVLFPSKRRGIGYPFLLLRDRC